MSIFRNRYGACITIAGVSFSMSRLPSWGLYSKGPSAWRYQRRSLSIRYGRWVAVVSR